ARSELPRGMSAQRPPRLILSDQVVHAVDEREVFCERGNRSTARISHAIRDTVLERSGNSEAGAVAAAVLPEPPADGRGAVGGETDPATTAQNAPRRITALPYRAINRRPVIVRMPGILDPLPHVPVQVMKAEPVCRE